MSIKKTVRFALLLAVLLSAHFFMLRQFSAATISYDIGKIPGTEAIDRIYAVFPNATFNWEMKMADYTLIMTTGNDHLHRQLTGLKKPWANPVNQDVILSRTAASRLLKTDIANAQSFKLFDRTYLVNQVIKEGNALYIAYDETLLNQGWQKTRLYFSAESAESAELSDEKLYNILTLLGFEVHHKHFFKNDVFLFYNLALLLLLYGLILLALHRHRVFRDQRSHLESLYEGYKPFYGLKTFIKNEKLQLLNLVLQAAFLILMLLIGLKLMSNLVLPAAWIPANWFSLTSYTDILKQSYHDFAFQLHFGFTPVAESSIQLLILLCLYLSVIDQWLLKRKLGL